MNYYSTEMYVNFIGCPERHQKVKAMAIYKYKKNYPEYEVILYDTDVIDAMNHAVSTTFRQNQNLHNVTIGAVEHLFQTLVENRYAEDELCDQYANIKHRVHEVTLAQGVASCQKVLRENRPYVMESFI